MTTSSPLVREHRVTRSATGKRGRGAPHLLHIWSGMTLSACLRLLRRNDFAVSSSRLPRVASMIFFALINSHFARRQKRRFGPQIAKTRLSAPPLFIIGHWRTGTTFMHELLALDPQFVWPRTYECMAPEHFVVTQGWARPRLSRFVPERRPMDAMAFGLERPQEDEFALFSLGVHSPYETIAFPNRRSAKAHRFDLTCFTERQQGEWQTTFLLFLQAVQLRAQRRDPDAVAARMLLKSPTHTARVGLLREMFPEAAFVHMVRNPFDLFASTKRLWTALFLREGFQRPQFEAVEGGVPSLDEYIFTTMDVLYRDFQQQTAGLPDCQFHNVRYEDLVALPFETLQHLYRRLNLGEFSVQRGRIADYLAALDHVPNQHSLTERDKAEVRRRWSTYFRSYEY